MPNILKRLLGLGDTASAQKVVAELEARQAGFTSALDENDRERRALALAAEAGEDAATERMEDLATKRMDLNAALARVNMALDDARATLAARQTSVAKNERARGLAKLRADMARYEDLAKLIGERVDDISSAMEESEKLAASIVAQNRALGGQATDLYLDRLRVWRRFSLHVNQTTFAHYLNKLDVPIGDLSPVPLSVSTTEALKSYNLPDNLDDLRDWSPEFDSAVIMKLGT